MAKRTACLKKRAYHKKRGAGRPQEKGIIFIVALFISIALLTIAIPTLFKLMSYRSLADKSYKSLAAINLAEAGVERALWELNFGDISSWAGTNELKTYSSTSFLPHGGGAGGTISISVQDPLGANPTIESTGSIFYKPPFRVHKSVRVVLKQKEIPFFDYGVYGDESVTVASNLNILGDVGTNGTGAGAVTIASNSTVNGDVTCGPDGDPEVAIQVEDTASISGRRDAAAKAKEFPPAQVPENLPYRGDINVSHETLTISEDGDYSSLVMGAGSQLLISGNVTLHVSGLFSLGSNTELQLEEGSSLTLYLSGSIEMNSNCSINNIGQDPTKLKFYGTEYLTGNVYFDSNQAFYGAVYMPQADLTISSNIDFYGSAYARNVYLNANVYVSYQEGQEDFSSLKYVVESWQQIQD